MRILYNLTFILFGILYLPYLIVTRRYKYGMLERLGILPIRIKDICSKKKVIWIHAVSVGEMKAASILAPLLRKMFPRHALIFSSVTQTGNKVAKTIATAEEAVFYLPFDISFITNKVTRIIRPDIFLSLETELWPNLISSLHKIEARSILVNGRISNKSYSRYKKAGIFISSILNKFFLILMQSDQDAVRILTIGAPKEKVFVTGNLKFDLPLLGIENKRQEIRSRLSIKDDEILLMAGSTHRGEEEIVMDCFTRLKKEYSNLRLFIASRHIERTSEVENALAKDGFKSEKISSIFSSSAQRPTTEGSPEQSRGTPNAAAVFLLDTIGDLRTMYSAADIVFVGGSLIKKGGQNPIEPASLGKPIIFGKFMFNFQDVARAFLKNEAAVQVGNREELYSAIRFLLDNPKERKKLGMNAKDTINKNAGSSQRTIEIILAHLSPFSQTT